GGAGLATAIWLRRRSGTAWIWMPRVEAFVLVAVVAAAALLMAQPPARDVAATTANVDRRATGATAFATADDLVVSVAVDPNRPGTNFVTVDLHDTRRPAPAPIRRVRLELARAGALPLRV